jgi:transmembrane sensor
MKAELYRRLGDARHQVLPVWTAERQQAVWNRIERVRAHRAEWRTVAWAMTAVLLVVGGLFAWRLTSLAMRGATATAVVEQNRAPLLHLEDGSVALPLSSNASVEPVEVGSSGVVVRVGEGRVRFNVAPQSRPFRVLASDVTVTVLGTIFTVSLERGEVRVGVERGRVLVSWPGGERPLGVAEEMVVRVAAPVASAEGEPGDLLPPEPSASPSADLEPLRAATRSWRALAQDGEYATAFEAMLAEGKSAVRDEPGDLWLAADVARLSGHPERSVTLLERVASAHPGDSRAPLAAFTLGRVLLDQLGRPHEAAQAFATAQRLAPGGALAQDALAREVESWSKAGEAAFARARAEEFVRRYPGSRRAKVVRRHGGLDE